MAVPNVAVRVVVTYPSGFTKHLASTTNSSGIAQVTWRIGGNFGPGTFAVAAKIQRQTYNSSFQVMPK